MIPFFKKNRRNTHKLQYFSKNKIYQYYGSQFSIDDII